MATLTRQRHMHVAYPVVGPGGYLVGPVAADDQTPHQLHHPGFSGGYRGTAASGDLSSSSSSSSQRHAVMMSTAAEAIVPYYTGTGPTPSQSQVLPSAPAATDVEKPIGYGAFGVVW